MREVKFKVWSFGQKRWVEKQSSVIKFSCELNEVFDTKEYAFQQYTGLEDKNGKEIYEGDILIYEYTQADMSSFSALESPFETCAIEEVVFENGAFRFKGDKYSTIFDDCSNMEVIGNIFENSELLSK